MYRLLKKGTALPDTVLYHKALRVNQHTIHRSCGFDRNIPAYHSSAETPLFALRFDLFKFNCVLEFWCTPPMWLKEGNSIYCSQHITRTCLKTRKRAQYTCVTQHHTSIIQWHIYVSELLRTLQKTTICISLRVEIDLRLLNLQDSHFTNWAIKSTDNQMYRIVVAEVS
jgi:hypothetical protein